MAEQFPKMNLPSGCAKTKNKITNNEADRYQENMTEQSFDIRNSQCRVKGEVHSITPHSSNEGLNNMDTYAGKRISKKSHVQQKQLCKSGVLLLEVTVILTQRDFFIASLCEDLVTSQAQLAIITSRYFCCIWHLF